MILLIARFTKKNLMGSSFNLIVRATIGSIRSHNLMRFGYGIKKGS